MPQTVAHVVSTALSADAKRGSASSNEGEKLTLVRRINVNIEVKAAAYDDDRPQVDLVESFGAHGSRVPLCGNERQERRSLFECQGSTLALDHDPENRRASPQTDSPSRASG